MARNSCGQRLPRDLGDGAGHLDAGGAAADEHEGQQALALGRVRRSARPASYATSIRALILSASSSVFSDGAYGAQSSWPKYELPAPAATIR